MTRPDELAPAGAPIRIWLAGLATLAALCVHLWAQAPWNLRLQAAWFDGLQVLAPREPVSTPVVIVAIDDRSLAALGQWPWPRTVLADLVGAIAGREPAAIGIDVLMPEPDRLSPERVIERIAPHDAALAQRLAALPGNDRLLADAIAAAPVVLVAAGAPAPSGGALHAAPIMVSGGSVEQARRALTHFPAAMTNLAELDRAAAGHGLISVEPSHAIYRRFPLAYDIGGTLAPALAVEMLRLALGQHALRLRMHGEQALGVSVGEVFVATEADAAVRIHFARGSRQRELSAIDVLEGRAPLETLSGKLVLIGTTAIGLADHRTTPLGDPMPDVEIHAQLIENLVDRSYLLRPGWAQALELTVFALFGLALVAATPRWRPWQAALLALACVAAPAAAAYLGFRTQRLLFDATPGLYLWLLFGVLLVLTLADAAQRRRALERAIQSQRERAAFVTGELAAAQRIQEGMLPDARTLAGEHRIELAAMMTPAREVGGDLFDFFMLDDHRLYLMVGDVSGKGVAASLFMAVAKSLCKSIALREPGACTGAVMTAANAEIARDNASALFVTAFVGILDIDTGILDHCNAGHDNPYLLRAGSNVPTRLSQGGGPPLCAVDGFAYTGTTHALQRGELLCLLSDGITEARNAAGELFGSVRLAEALARLQTNATTARGLVDGLRAELATFVGDAEAADDMTVLALRWNGPPD